MTGFTKSQIDRLGNRLRDGPTTEEDLQLLEAWKHSFGPAYEFVLQTLHRRSPSVKGRPEKSTLSVVAKLRREKMRLSRMQDIAGCRIAASDIEEQNQLIDGIRTDFPSAILKDRRESPSYGYRAVHLIATAHGKPVEIQVRTSLQQAWAEFSERASDRIGPEIKYGGGPTDWQTILRVMSLLIRKYESYEMTEGRREAERMALADEYERCQQAMQDYLHGHGGSGEEPSNTVDHLMGLERGMNSLEASDSDKEFLRAFKRQTIAVMDAFVLSLEENRKGTS